ncbi:TetR family transcriptional regulator [Nitrospirillum amazonense]|uniref:TetR family transcriptional regulator n=1 Tax=Nitrospirillum amazonense TaxID=28077 RepID=A0A560J4J6_9PROT|nr:TetR/AcrR family transcriptional regulator [Nitrospirillum amazonense]TWB65957.1 TetR family transcriptional regulator [Nitrospirillum amazonense]
MARPRKFTRDAVLDRAVPVFWRRGYAGTNVQELERATGVNKSGLYTEFEGKEDLFLAALQRYLDTGPALRLLDQQPLGWANIERFLAEAPFVMAAQPGCFAVNVTGEVDCLPSRAADIIRAYNRRRADAIARNVAAAQPALDARVTADMIAAFFIGTCMDVNLDADPAPHRAKVGILMSMLRSL